MRKENIIGTNFIMTNRDLISKFGVNSAVMLGKLYGRYKINEKNLLKALKNSVVHKVNN